MQSKCYHVLLPYVNTREYSVMKLFLFTQITIVMAMSNVPEDSQS